MRRQEALKLVGLGLPIVAIAERMGLSTITVRSHLRKALSTESLYPGSLTAEEVAQLRQIQAEVLSNSRSKALRVQAVVAARIGTPAEKNMDATASARLLEAVVRSIDLEAALFGTKQPTRIVEESLRYELRKIDGRITIHFDREQLRPKWTPLGIRDTAANAVERGDSLANSNGSIAAALPNAILDDSSEDGIPQ